MAPSRPALLVSPAPVTAALMRAMPALWGFDARPLSELRLPTLVMCGTADPIVPVSHARALHEAIPGSKLALLDGAGHVAVSQRHPGVADAVRRFLASV